jgi:tetratricopeptide (TPR) repeat protein
VPKMRCVTSVLAALALQCTAPLVSPAWAVDTEETPAVSQADPDYVAGKKAVAAEDWNRAIALLSKAALRDDNNADIHNLLGFAYRHVGDFERAFAHYNRALSLNPRHRGAHEYMGVAYLLQDNLPKADEHLAALAKICLVPCEEYEDLKKEIDEYRERHAGASVGH